jgi:hypothetical protein
MMHPRPSQDHQHLAGSGGVRGRSTMLTDGSGAIPGGSR